MGGTARLLSTLLILATLQYGCISYSDEYPTVRVAQGFLRGRKVRPTNTNTTAYYNFLGIPYARPPVGELRFKAPQPVEPWMGTLDATKEGNFCVQPSEEESVIGDENCLFINVYTPQLPSSRPLLPVMFWIHEGGFLVGSGDRLAHGPEYLLDARVLYVSCNYRLGVFGFISTEDGAAPGNAALKDQVLALRWVQQNIAAFGGDPDKVTIFGESAGGSTVLFHMMSPMSKGLFRAGISQSGSPINPWALALRPRENAFMLGKALGYSGSSSKRLVNYLCTINATRLYTVSQATLRERDRYRLVGQPYLPAVEPNLRGETPFLTDNPLRLLEEGKFKNLPYLTGVNTAEGLIYLALVDILTNPEKLPQIERDFSKVFQPELIFCKGANRSDAIGKVKSFYFGSQPVSNDTLDIFIQMLTDMFFGAGVKHTVETMSSVSSAPVYLYELSYDGGLAWVKKTTPIIANFSGVSHGDDLGYIYEAELSPSAKDVMVRSEVVRIWTDFAKTGNPTPESTDRIPVWPRYSKRNAHYLDIGEHLVVRKDLNKRRLDFWDKLCG